MAPNDIYSVNVNVIACQNTLIRVVTAFGSGR